MLRLDDSHLHIQQSSLPNYLSCIQHCSGDKQLCAYMLSERFTQALIYAAQLDAHQVGKGSGVPYIAHLLGVASIGVFWIL